MTITAARYNTEEEISIAATLDSGGEIFMPSYPSSTHYDNDMQEFLDGGGTIAPYDPYYGWSLEQAVDIKKMESEQYAQELIDDAYTNPQEGVITDGPTHKRRTESRRKDKADKQAGDVSLTQEEKDEAKIDQKLSEYETKCWDASDKVLANIDKEDTVENVMSIDVATNTLWPVWEPPV